MCSFTESENWFHGMILVYTQILICVRAVINACNAMVKTFFKLVHEILVMINENYNNNMVHVFYNPKAFI